jgi:hypothetical protein
MAMGPLACKTSRDHGRLSFQLSPGTHPKRACLLSHDLRSVWTMEPRPKKRLDHVREAIRRKH